jgi:hydrogenase maturation protease
MGEQARILILGIGNLLWADEGWGVRAVEEFHRRYRFPENVRLMDGGTQGLYLVQHVAEADVMIVFDAVDYGLAPGTLKLATDGDVPKFLGAKKMSLHQTGFQEVVMTAELLDRCPRHMLLVGVQPQELEDFGGSLREATRARIPEAIACALAFLRRFDCEPVARAAPLADSETIASAELALSAYEAGRPAEGAACRTGDPRCILRNDVAECA